MPEVDINLLAVLVAAIINMLIGSVWYSNAMFSKQWVSLRGKKMDEIQGGGQAYVWSTVGAIVMAYVLAHFVDYAQADTLVEGMQTGFWAWLGFVITTMAATVVFEERPFGLFLMNIGYNLVALAAMGALLAVWV